MERRCAKVVLAAAIMIFAKSGQKWVYESRVT
jgi:hypothetical protein